MKYGSTDILVGDCRERLAELPARSVHACITSPPYWGLRDYKAGEKMIGLEPTLEEHIANLIAVFREVRRVLRDDGTVWMVYGDAYAGSGGFAPDAPCNQRRAQGESWGAFHPASRQAMSSKRGAGTVKGYRTGDLLMLPHRLAFALHADGWLVRSAIVWAKGVSFCPTYSGSVMPESVSGTRWERCRVKESPCPTKGPCPDRNDGGGGDMQSWRSDEWSPCPGCPKCESNGGYVLRRGSGRCTSAYEMVFQLAKASAYYYDSEAVRETAFNEGRVVKQYATDSKNAQSENATYRGFAKHDTVVSGRNLRNVWTINPAPFPDAHFATFPPALVEPIVKAATSERGVCPVCGAPWARVVETMTAPDRPNRVQDRNGDANRHGPDDRDGDRRTSDSRTLGWRPTCEHHFGLDIIEPPTDPEYNRFAPVPSTILDPFIGAGTSGLVANQLGSNCIGIELNPDYATMARDRIGRELRPSTHRNHEAEHEAPLFQGGGD